MQSMYKSIRLEGVDLSIEKLIGHGSFGKVYRVNWESKMTVAAKFIPKIISSERIENEVNILKKLHHKYIITFYKMYDVGRFSIILMEYASKGSLYDYMKHRNFIEQDIRLKWQTQATESVQYLQYYFIVHMDIKSSNFVITSKDTLKLIDFGQAKQLSKSKLDTFGSGGTTKWQAPEVFKYGFVSLKADIFGLGIVFSELETCGEPYKGLSKDEVSRRVAEEYLRPYIPSSTCTHPSIKNLIELCWHEDPSKRPCPEFILEQLRLADISSNHCDTGRSRK